MVPFCPSCSGALPSWFAQSARTESFCPNCLSRITLEVFPALFRTPAALEASHSGLTGGEACCFEHSTRLAVDACHRCGRFVCTLCEVNMQGQVWCPSCLQLDKAEPAVEQLSRHRVLYDSIALALATWPLLTFYFAALTAPIAIFVVARYWKRPTSLIPRNKWRFVVALILALLELGFVVMVIVIAVLAATRRLR